MGLKYVEFDSSFTFHFGNYSPWENMTIFGLCFLLCIHVALICIFWVMDLGLATVIRFTSLGGKSKSTRSLICSPIPKILQYRRDACSTRPPIWYPFPIIFERYHKIHLLSPKERSDQLLSTGPSRMCVGLSAPAMEHWWSEDRKKRFFSRGGINVTKK